MTINLRLLVRFVSIFILIVVLGFIVSRNFPLFGLTINLEERDISDLTPDSRVSKVLSSGSEVKKQVEDLIYFTTESEGFDKAIVRMTFLAGNSDQDLHLGFKDRPEWHYKTKPVFLPLLLASV